MYLNTRNLSFVIALCGLIAFTGRAQAASSGPQDDPYWGPFVTQDMRGNGSYAPAVMILANRGPEADLYWGQFVTQNTRGNGPYAPAIVVLANLPGLESDPYWGAFVTQNGTRQVSVWTAPVEIGIAAAAPRELPTGLTASTWQLVDYAIIGMDGKVSRPLGTDTTGYLIISPERYAAVTIAPGSNSPGKFISYVGKLDYQGDKSIHPFVSLDPSQVGVDQVKSWELTANQLILTTPADGADGAFGRITWELIK